MRPDNRSRKARYGRNALFQPCNRAVPEYEGFARTAVFVENVRGERLLASLFQSPGQRFKTGDLECRVRIAGNIPGVHKTLEGTVTGERRFRHIHLQRRIIAERQCAAGPQGRIRATADRHTMVAHRQIVRADGQGHRLVRRVRDRQRAICSYVTDQRLIGASNARSRIDDDRVILGTPVRHAEIKRFHSHLGIIGQPELTPARMVTAVESFLRKVEMRLATREVHTEVGFDSRIGRSTIGCTV